jgi:hypothetical protein
MPAAPCPTLAELDIVTLTRDLPCPGLRAGEEHTIVWLAPDGSEALLEMPLEYPDTDPINTKLVTVPADALRVIYRPSLPAGSQAAR